MDLEDVKALIISLIVSSTQKYSLQQLLTDFHNETGCHMPTFQYPNAKSFLMSLTDTLKVTGPLNKENVTLVKSQRSSHIDSLVSRQVKMSKHKRKSCKGSNHFPDISSDSRTLGGMIKSQSKKDCNKTRQYVSKPKLFEKHNEIDSKDEGIIHEEDTPNGRKDERDKSIKESHFLFKEDDIASLSPNIIESNLVNHSFPAPCNSDTESEIDSVTIPSNSPDESMWIPDSVKMKLKKLIDFQTHGIWCCELPDLYNQLYNSPLDYKEYGFRSLIEMVMSLNEIFRNVRPHNEDWLLFDASKPPSDEEKAISSMPKREIPSNVEKNATSLLRSHFETSGKSSVEIGDFLLLYFIKYGVKLEFREYGFPNVKDFIKELSGCSFTIAQEQNKLVISPISDNEGIPDDFDLVKKPNDEMYPQLFPENICFHEKFTYLDMGECFKVGKKIQVVVADVWSPTQFYVQLKRYETDFRSLVKNLEKFYHGNRVKYRMPKVMLQPGQVCVTFTKATKGIEEWYRSKIVRAYKNKVNVHFVDYGMNCKVKSEDVMFMHRSFLDLPAQCFAAQLSNLSPVSTSKWPLDASERFLELVSVPKATLLVESLDLQNKIVFGTLFVKGNRFRESVSDTLVKEGKAVFKENKSDYEKAYPPEDAEENPGEREEGIDTWRSSDVSSTAFNYYNVEAQRGMDENFFDDRGEAAAPESAETGEDGDIVTAEDIPPASDIQENKLDFDFERRLRISWTVGKEIEALAFNLLSENEFIRGIARNNFDLGLEFAKTLAEKIIFSSEISMIG